MTPTYLMSEVPHEWQEQFIKKNRYYSRDIDKTWKDITGVSASDSRFTIVVPVHNEEVNLESSVGALFLSYFPNNANIDVNFVLNGCEDRSSDTLKGLLRTKGSLVKCELNRDESASLGDEGLDKEYYQVQTEGIVYRIFTTDTLGKANALRLGANISLKEGSKILVAFDANNYLEPDAIALMYRDAHKHFEIEDGNTVLLSAMPKKVHKSSLNKFEQLLREHGVWDNQDYTPVFGWCMAMNVLWAVDNIQPVAVEDYALGVMARSKGKHVGIVKEAAIWGYRTNFTDSLNQFRRSIRGRMQLIALHPELKQIIKKDNYFMRPFTERLSVIVDSIRREPKKTPRHVWKFIYGETGIALGKIDYKNNPKNQSWKSLASTK